MVDLQTWIKSLSQLKRDELARNAKRASTYVTSIAYKNFKSTSLPMAVEIHRMSEGKLNLQDMVYGGQDVDWSYLRDILNEMNLTKG